MTDFDYTSDDPIVQAELDAARSFQQAAMPDEPRIDAPGNPVVQLAWGLDIGGERRTYAEVRELTGADEEALARLDPQKPSYPVLVVNTVVSRAVTSLGGVPVKADQLQDLLMGDRDRIFKEVLLSTYGDVKEYDDLICPTCNEGNDVQVNVREVVDTVDLEGDDNHIEVTLRDGKVARLHYPTGRDQMWVYGSDAALSEPEINTRILQRCIEDVDGFAPANASQWAKNLTVRNRALLVEALANGPSVRFKEVEVPCGHCGKTLPFVLGWADLLQL